MNNPYAYRFLPVFTNRWGRNLRERPVAARRGHRLSSARCCNHLPPLGPDGRSAGVGKRGILGKNGVPPAQLPGQQLQRLARVLPRGGRSSRLPGVHQASQGNQLFGPDFPTCMFTADTSLPSRPQDIVGRNKLQWQYIFRVARPVVSFRPIPFSPQPRNKECFRHPETNMYLGRC